MNQVNKLTESAFFDLNISNNCTTFEDAPMGVHNGWKLYSHYIAFKIGLESIVYH